MTMKNRVQSAEEILKMLPTDDVARLELEAQIQAAYEALQELPPDTDIRKAAQLFDRFDELNREYSRRYPQPPVSPERKAEIDAMPLEEAVAEFDRMVSQTVTSKLP